MALAGYPQICRQCNIRSAINISLSSVVWVCLRSCERHVFCQPISQSLSHDGASSGIDQVLTYWISSLKGAIKARGHIPATSPWRNTYSALVMALYVIPMLFYYDYNKRVVLFELRLRIMSQPLIASYTGIYTIIQLLRNGAASHW